jgi:phosphatidylglycerol:prolipoprotein diacylglycerol transferase
MLVAHGFGRLGCLMAGCCHGEYLGQEYVFGGIKMDGSQGWGYYVPTQLYEALFLLLLCALLSLLLLKRNFKFALPVYLAAYGIWRFLIEFARADDRGAFIGSLSPSQTLSLILIVLSVPAYFILKKFVNESKEHDAKLQAVSADEGEEIEAEIEE